MRRKTFPTGVLLGEPPKDRPLRHGEHFAWNGKRYLYHNGYIPFRIDRDRAGIYEQGPNGFRGPFIGEAKTVFEAERLLGIRRDAS